MLRSLVGSEMCIRDRVDGEQEQGERAGAQRQDDGHEYHDTDEQTVLHAVQLRSPYTRTAQLPAADTGFSTWEGALGRQTLSSGFRGGTPEGQASEVPGKLGSPKI